MTFLAVTFDLIINSNTVLIALLAIFLLIIGTKLLWDMSNRMSRIEDDLQIKQESIQKAALELAPIIAGMAELQHKLSQLPPVRFRADKNGIILDVSENSKDILGWGKETLVGQPAAFLVPDEWRAQHDRKLAQRAADPSVHIPGLTFRDVSAKHGNGGTVPVHISLKEIVSAEGAKEYIVDITRLL